MTMKVRHLVTLRELDTLQTLTDVAVTAVALAGMAATGPGGAIAILKIVNMLDGTRWNSAFHRRRFPRALRRAERRGLVTISGGQHQPPRVRLTDKGTRLLAQRKAEGLAQYRPKRWDGKWRLIIFDVPEGRHRERDVFRKSLRALGFHRLQQSVWFFPFDCREVVELLRAAHNLHHITARYLVVDEIEDDELLRRNFEI